MADLRTRYLGMELRSPLVASSSPLTGTLDGLRRLEEAGASALELNVYMDGHAFETVDQLRGRLSQRSVPNPAAFERANYIKTLASHSASG
jgi:hypothetical protein